MGRCHGWADRTWRGTVNSEKTSSLPGHGMVVEPDRQKGQDVFVLNTHTAYYPLHTPCPHTHPRTPTPPPPATPQPFPTPTSPFPK